jgi:SAM-dependent methyltransferase
VTHSPAGPWQFTYQHKDPRELSWFQREPVMSLALLEAARLQPGSAVVDVGGGASTLADHLLTRGVTDVTVLDIAEAALQASLARLGDGARTVTWLAQDLLSWTPTRRYDLWHDRAVYHFLTDPADRDEYQAVLDAALSPGGHVVIGTFAEDGPQSCSGLPVARYGPRTLAQQFHGYAVITADREEHHTPTGSIQPFTWLLLRRT